MPLERGLYELLSTDALAEELASLDARWSPDLPPLRAAEAADRIAQHLARLIQRALETVGEKDRVTTGVAVARALVAQLAARFPDADLSADAPEVRGRVLRAIARRQPDGSLESLVEPLIPLLDTALLTNAPGEPRVGSQIATEIASADRIDVVMAFVRRSGVAPLLEALRKHRDGGRALRSLPAPDSPPMSTLRGARSTSASTSCARGLRPNGPRNSPNGPAATLLPTSAPRTTSSRRTAPC